MLSPPWKMESHHTLCFATSFFCFCNWIPFLGPQGVFEHRLMDSWSDSFVHLSCLEFSITTAHSGSFWCREFGYWQLNVGQAGDLKRVECFSSLYQTESCQSKSCLSCFPPAESSVPEQLRQEVGTGRVSDQCPQHSHSCLSPAPLWSSGALSNSLIFTL